RGRTGSPWRPCCRRPSVATPAGSFDLLLSSCRFSPGEPGRTDGCLLPGDAGGAPDRDHLALSRTSTTRQRLVADSRRVSMLDTRSPTPTALGSSCALTLLVRRMTLP